MDMEDEVIHEFNKQAQIIELEREKAEQEKQAKNQLIKKLASMQMSAEEIAQIAGMKVEEVLEVLQK